jgi:hypothetical protein
MKLVLGTGRDDPAMLDPTLVKAIARGHAWFDEITAETPSSISDFAKREGVTMRYVSQHPEFAFLAPTIVDAILAGRQPVDLTLQSLKQVELPLGWSDQADILGVT